MRVIAIGGGVAGLATALALARAGHAVTVLERDAAEVPGTPEGAFARWRRPGAPQLGHSHAFLARLRNLLRDRAPDVLDALVAAGARDLAFADHLPPGLRDRSPRPGDEDLALLACRRSTFEWALRRVVLRQEGVVWRAGVRALGLAGESRPAGIRVLGVEVLGPGGRRETLHADALVDASGPGSAVRRWLGALGAPDVDEEDHDAGIFYASRFYRLRAEVDALAGLGVVGADLGYMKYGIFPGDAGTFSVTLAAPPDDPELRRLLRPRGFDAAAASLPALRSWIDPQRSEATTRVRGMAGLRNRRRRFVREGRPLALGLHVVGDAAVCSNPLYGRGCSLAFVQAHLLADSLREHGADADAVALAFDAAMRREIDPWFRAARDQDRDAIECEAARRRGEDPYAAAAPGGVVDPRAWVRSVLRDGLFPLLRTDADALRAFARSFNLLDPPDDLLRRPDLLPRILAAYQARGQRAPEEPLGPPREEMVEVLARSA